MYDTGFTLENQVLVDIHPITGDLVDWAKHKRNNIQIAESFRRLERVDNQYQGRAAQLIECGSWLEFRKFESGDRTLNRANFCKYRLCPMCAWRRSLKIFGQTSKVMDVAESAGYRFVFVTLTLRNCSGENLGAAIDRLYGGFTRLLRQNKYRQVIGWMRTLEVTHNIDKKSSSFDTYHPHIHAIFVVRNSYFKKHYIPQADLITHWQTAAKLPYLPNVDIRAVKPKKTRGAVKEISKYVTKASNLITGDPDLTDSGIRYLDRALAGRRLVSYGGILKSIKSDLKLDDPERGDLVNVDGETELRDDLAYVIEAFSWHSGYGQFTRCQTKKGA